MVRLALDDSSGKRLSFEVKKMINGGYAGRNQEEVRKHVEELRKHNIPAPKKTPAFWPKLPDRITTSGEVEVVGGHTSGEAEFVLLCTKDDIYVAAGSDHTDRKAEEHSILMAKQICPNVISKKVWRLDDVKDRWDNLLLRAWVDKDGKRYLYQEARLSALMRPEDLLNVVKEQVDGDLAGTVIYSGTVGTVGGELIFSNMFEVQIIDEEAKKSLRCAYYVRPIAWFKGDAQ